MSIFDEGHTEWVKSLKVGDTVAVIGGARRDIRKGVVEKITPKGRLNVRIANYARTFKPDGREHGGDPYWGCHIEPFTNEIATKMAATSMRDILSNLWRHSGPLTDAQILQAAELLTNAGLLKP